MSNKDRYDLQLKAMADAQHLQRRSQRPYQPSKGENWLPHLARLGLIRLQDLVHA